MEKLKSRIMVGALGHVTDPDFAIHCLRQGFAVSYPTFAKDASKLEAELREILGAGIDYSLLGANLMPKSTNYVEALSIVNLLPLGFISMSAGFDKEIFKKTEKPVLVKSSSVSLGECALKLGASAVIMMGADAGGHVGFKDGQMVSTDKLVQEFGKPGSTIWAGGITSEDRFLQAKNRCLAVQMGTRFLCTEESPVNRKTKELYIKSKKSDTCLIPSTIGMPLRVIRNSFAELVLACDAPKPKNCVNCSLRCDRKYCLQEHIRLGMQGDMQEGLFPVTQHLEEIDSLLHLKDIASWQIEH